MAFTKGTKLEKIGSGWKKVTKKGEKYISLAIELDGKKLAAMLFENKEKDKPTSPDFRLVLSSMAPKSAAPSTRTAAPAAAAASEEAPW